MVTRQGWGDLWRMPSADEAELHPLVQFGDAVVTGPEGILRQYNLLELPRMVRLLGVPGLSQEVEDELARLQDLPDRKRLLPDHLMVRIWTRMVGMARVPPSKAEKIVDLIRMDRQVTKEKIMADKAAAKTAAAPKAPKVVPPKRASKYGEADTISLLKGGEDNKPYHGTDNNPKRKGSKAADWFRGYKDGMTVADYKKHLDKVGAGNQLTSTLNYDIAHGYVVVKTTKAA